MARLTIRDSKFPCKINCEAEDWMQEFYGGYPKGDICDTCPFFKYIVKLAKLENKEENAIEGFLDYVESRGI